MKAQHTPGPWRVIQHNHADGDLWLSVNQEVEVNGVKVGAEWVAEIKYLTTEQERQWANARLIAAAPEMLRELKASVLWLRQYVLPQAGNPQAVQRFIDGQEKAIAKVEGQVQHG